MIELVSIEVQNFRSFGEATFTPLRLDEGMTAVNGPNGSGKSSLATHAVMWALYGNTPEGVSVKALRRQGSEDEVQVKVTFIHNGQTIIVTRGLKGKNDTTVANISVDGVEQTNVSSKTATAWVTERLGIDAEAFTTAFVIRQKEVDALVRARPAERRALIERLAGIDKMSEALKKARENARDAKAHITAYEDTTDVEILIKELSELELKLQTKEEELSHLVAEKIENQNKVKAYEQAFKTSNERKDAYDRLEHAWELQHQETVSKEKQYQEKQELAKNADMLPDIQAQIEELQQKKTETETLHQEAKETKRLLDEKENILNDLKEEFDNHRKLIHGYKEKLSRLEDALAENKNNEVKEALQQAVTSREHVVSTLGAVRAEKDRLERILNILNDTSGESTACPTCSTPMAEPGKLVHEITGQTKELSERVVTLKEEKNALDLRVSEHEANIAAYERAAREHSDVTERLSEAEEKHKKLQSQIATLDEESEELSKKFTLAQESIQLTLELFPDLPQQLQVLNQSLRKAENAVEAEELLPGLRAAWEESLKQDNLLKRQLEEYNVRDLEADISRTEQELEKVRAAYMRVFEQVNAKEKEVLLLGKEVEKCRNSITVAESQRERRKQAIYNAEIANSVSSALDEFRKDRIARLAPELSEVASDIVSVMTEGKYSTVELDEDFTPILTETATGLERPVSWLSGGEESAVALALRIAVGEVVSGQHAGMLVLDEVLTAQDKARRASVMGAIRELKSRQIITINHVSEATDMVDLVVNVVPSPDENGYTVMQGSSNLDVLPSIESDGIDEL